MRDLSWLPPSAGSNVKTVAKTAIIYAASDISAVDAARAFHDASAAANAAAVAKTAAFALMLAAAEPAGPVRTYSLLIMGSALNMQPPTVCDVRATSEGRAWAEMVRHSPRFTAMIIHVCKETIAEWRTLMSKITRLYTDECRVIAIVE